MNTDQLTDVEIVNRIARYDALAGLCRAELQSRLSSSVPSGASSRIRAAGGLSAYSDAEHARALRRLSEDLNGLPRT